MRLDIRDVWFWAKEAERRAWSRKVGAYNAALLPWQKADVVKQTMDSLTARGLEFAYGERVEDTEKENAERMAQAMERKKAARKSGRKAPRKMKKRSSKIRRLK